MAQYVCDNCGATVTDEQFCPNCGAWIDPTKEIPHEHADEEYGDEYEEFSLEEGPPPPRDPAPVRVPRQEVQCPSCGSANPLTNRHCEECGARLSQGTLPVAPRPAVQATAGVRAAMAIAGLLLGVVVIAVLFNIVTGGDETTETTLAEGSTTTTSAAVEPAPVNVLDVTCSVEGLSGFGCSNLIDGGDGDSYQVNWETLEEGQDVTLDLIFAEPMIITGLIWENLPEGDRFFQNYRARGITVSDGSATALPVPLELADQPGSQPVEYASMRTLKLSITVDTVYLPQARNNQVFTELAIAGIEPVGYPVPTATTTTTGAETTTTTAGS